MTETKIPGAAAPKITRLYVRLSVHDKYTLKQRSISAGSSLSEFVLSSALNQIVTPPPSEMTRKYLSQISRIGNNLNQLARAANRGVNIPAAEFEKLTTAIKKLDANIRGRL